MFEGTLVRVSISTNFPPQASKHRNGTKRPVRRLFSNISVVHSAVALVGSLCNCLGGVEPSAALLNSLPRILMSLTLNEECVHTAQLVDNERAKVLCLRFLLDVVNQFIAKPDMLVEKADVIITDLCLALGAKVVYYALALIVSNVLEPKTAFFVVQMLNRILLTQSSLGEFRELLRKMDFKAELDLFKTLYGAWCHNPVALLAFCLLTENYNHCRFLIRSFGDLTLSVEVLVEMDQLVQLLESPVFASLRLHLIDKRYSASLQETLYCLLMCLPQTEAFETLRRRLQCLPRSAAAELEGTAESRNSVDFDALLNQFHRIQKLHSPCGVRDAHNLWKISKIISTSSEMSPAAKTGPLMLTSNEFLIQGLEKLGIQVNQPDK